ncbi:MAG: hypothetical protein R6U57_03970 [Anaerolineales bacterium]
MQILFIILLVLFSIGIGFFVGVLFFSLDNPLSEKISSGIQSLGKNQEEPDYPPPGGGEDLTSHDRPSPDAKLLLQVWEQKGDTILYGFKGKFLRKGELPEDIRSILEPFPQKSEAADQIFEKEEIPAEKKAGASEKEETPLKPLSLSSEIDKILQEKLAGSPLNEKGIRLTENLNNEIIIWVGLTSYASIDAIPDVEIQKIIKESVQDWEDRAK